MTIKQNRGNIKTFLELCKEIIRRQKKKKT
jgi:hypothetical protein